MRLQGKGVIGGIQIISSYTLKEKEKVSNSEKNQIIALKKRWYSYMRSYTISPGRENSII